MEKILYFFVHLGLPVLILLAVFKLKTHSKASILVNAIFYSSILLFLYYWGQYPLVASYYFRYVLLAIIIVIAWKFYMNWDVSLNSLPTGVVKYIRFATAILLAIVFSYLCFNAIIGQRYDLDGVELDFPLKNGSYYISSGGNNKAINNHFRSYASSQQFALDMSKLNTFGTATKNPLSSENQNHFIFGESVYCPCDGVVIESSNEIRDNEGTSMDVKSEDGSGNFIKIKCDDLIVFIGHLQYASVLVGPGDQVRVGDLIGKVGNSGFSEEPHLHFQASKYEQDSSLIGIPMSFDSWMPVRNSIIKK